MKDEAQLKEYYDRELVPALSELEGRRKKVMLGVIASTLLGLALMASPLIVLGGAAALGMEENALCCCLGFIPFFAGVAVMGGGYHLVTRAYIHDFKANVMGKIVKFLDEGLSYSKDGGISQSVYMESKIFLTHADRYHCEDSISGTVGKTKVEFSEVLSEYKTETRDSKGRRHTQWHTIFRGVFFVADFNKEFKGLTLVLPDTAQNLFGNLVGNFLQKHNIGRPDLVKLEDPEFEKLFVVYGNDQVEARYILSPSLMQRMSEFKKKTGKRIHFSFCKSKVYVAVPYGENLFEPRIFRTLLEFAQVKKYSDDLQLVLGIVEDLNLNTRIWGKG